MTSLTSLKTTANFLNRHADKTYLYLSGWSFPADIFNLNKEANCIVITINDLTTFSSDLVKILTAHHINKIHIEGFSLGGYLGLDFLQHYPEKVESLYFYGCRPLYPNDNIIQMKNNLVQNQKGTLTHFWKSCFADQAQFKDIYKSYFKETISNISIDSLLNGLTYLAKINMFEWCKRNETLLTKTTFFHGEHDKIASIKEFKQLTRKFKQINQQIISKKGHFTF